jgi:hypothetical protein
MESDLSHIIDLVDAAWGSVHSSSFEEGEIEAAVDERYPPSEWPYANRATKQIIQAILDSPSDVEM